MHAHIIGMFVPGLERERSVDDFIDAEEGFRIIDLQADRTTPSPDQKIFLAERTALIGVGLATLTERERTIIVDRFGLNGEESMTLEAIGRKLGLSRERIRQLEREAKGKIRAFLESRRRELI